jgi:hypothetical protein
MKYFSVCFFNPMSFNALPSQLTILFFVVVALLGASAIFGLLTIFPRIGSYAVNTRYEDSMKFIVRRTSISKRFAEKILSIMSKYYQRPHDLKLLIHTAMLLYNDQKHAAEKA